jgi:anti-sigma regulatory factor (Ser/Thr protein kinase)
MVSERFAHMLSIEELDTARLLVSELVTNAVIHGRGRITVRARLSEDRLFVEVIDEGSGLEPAVRKRSLENPRAGGKGLAIVDAASSRWGIHNGTTHVWFELDTTRGRRGSPAAPRSPVHASVERDAPVPAG